MGKLSPEALEKRREGLEEWFHDFLDSVAMGPELQSQLDAFLVNKNEEDDNADTPNSRRGHRIDNLSRISPGKVLKAGYLNKLGGNKTGSAGNWKKRYFVLQDDMKYYEDESTFSNGGAGKGLVKLNVFYVSCSDDSSSSSSSSSDSPSDSSPATSSPSTFQFTVHAMPHPLVCRADTQEELDSWVQTLNSLADVGR